MFLCTEMAGAIIARLPFTSYNGKVKSAGLVSNGRVLDGPVEKRMVNVDFEWNGDEENVAITGSFYEWKVKIPLCKKANKFYARIHLPRGRHEFKFIVNGIWKYSPNYGTVVNGYGELNNYVEI